MKLTAVVLMVTALTFAGYGHAQGTDSAHRTNGKVTKVDRAKGTVTIAHGPVASLKWPAMTMPFGVSDKALLDKVQVGTDVEFSFVQSGSSYTITGIK
jgi:Cu/Ag efflux protein CusF